MVKLNEKEMTQEAFEQEKKKLESKKGVRVVMIKEGVYKTQIQG
jgi:hypothetical protein